MSNFVLHFAVQIYEFHILFAKHKQQLKTRAVDFLIARINLVIVSYFVLFFCKDLNAHLRETEEVISTIYDDDGLKKVRNL